MLGGRVRRALFLGAVFLSPGVELLFSCADHALAAAPEAAREPSLLEKLETRKRLPYWDELDELSHRREPLNDEVALRYFRALRLDAGESSYRLGRADLAAIREDLQSPRRVVLRGQLDERLVAMLYLAENLADVYRRRIAQTPAGLKELLGFANRLDCAAEGAPATYELHPTYQRLLRQMQREGAGAAAGLPVWRIDPEDALVELKRLGLMAPVGPFPGLSEADVRGLLEKPGFVLSRAALRRFGEHLNAVLTVAAKVGYTGFNASRERLFDRARLLLSREDRETPTSYQQYLRELEEHLQALQREGKTPKAP
jgi:hypothetical protein